MRPHRPHLLAMLLAFLSTVSLMNRCNLESMILGESIGTLLGELRQSHSESEEKLVLDALADRLPCLRAELNLRSSSYLGCDQPELIKAAALLPAHELIAGTVDIGESIWKRVLFTQALGRVDDRGAARDCVDVLIQDESAAVRRAAIESAQSFAGELDWFVGITRRGMHDVSADVRTLAVRGLLSMSAPPPELVITAVVDASDDVRITGLSVLELMARLDPLKARRILDSILAKRGSTQFEEGEAYRVRRIETLIR